jgi:very-short-patch-repair endonuclease
MTSLTDLISSELNVNPGQTAAQLSKRLKADRRDVSRALQNELRSEFRQDKAYKWWPVEILNQQAKQSGEDEEGFANTPLARLARYYLACLGQDDVGEISVWARGHHGLDYAPLAALPSGDIDTVFQEEAPAALLTAMQRDRTPKLMYLGYPICINRFQSKKGATIHRLEPLFVIPIQFEHSNNRGAASLTSDYPMINTAVLKRYSNVDNDALMDELLALEDELGFSGEGEIPELDEIVERLQSIRSDWPWHDTCDASAINMTPPISSLDEPGLYNRAILLMAERQPYTQGLESELRELAKLPVQKYAETALGSLVNNDVAKVTVEKPDESSSKTEQPLIEVLPMNSEQREAVSRALTQPLTVITGPPGTGKSQVVTNLLANAAWQNKKVLFASKNNKAVDVVELRVNNLGPRPILLRMGSNQYQIKLRDYLQGMLSATAGPDELLDFDDTVATHKKLAERIRDVQSELNQVVALRNSVDAREQSVETFRAQLGDATFSRAREFDIAELQERFDELKEATKAIDNRAISFIDKVAWPFTKSRKFDRARQAMSNLKDDFQRMDIAVPSVDPAKIDADARQAFIDKAKVQVKAVLQVAIYFHSLKLLQESETLESLNAQLRKLLDEVADNSERLWASWLKVSPSRLSQQDRQLLAKYVSVIQMIMDAGSGRIEKSVWREYYKLNGQVSHLLSCWAVTSLSAKGKLPFVPGYFDLVVFDEASQCDIASALPLLYRAKSVVVIGDPMQLAHISSIQKKQDQQLLERFDLVGDYTQWAYSWNSLFDMSRSYAGGDDIVNLRDHHRSHANIVNFSNSFFYEGRLRVATQYDKLRYPARDQAGVRWIDVKGETVRPQNGGAVNRPEAEAIVKELQHLIIDQNYRGSIGVVSPFRAQANLVKELCYSDEALSRILDDLEFLSDTVHRFQGDERDLIIFSPVVSAGAAVQTLGFLKRNGNLFNVAITRARAMLLVIGDQAAARGSGVEYLSEFARYVDQLNQSEEEKTQTLDEDQGPTYPTSVDRAKVSNWEVIFYEALYQAGIRTIPQYPIEQYLLDLAVVDGERRLDIEVDGERYHRNWTGELCRRDQIRNRRLFELGWDVQRFWVYEIRDDLEGCVKRVADWLAQE